MVTNNAISTCGKLFKITVLYLTLLFIVSCNLLYPDDDLTLQRQDYTGKELRMNGYYYCYNEYGMVIRFYYMNGLLLKTGSHKGKDFEIIDKELVDEYSKYPNMYNHKYNWGTFLIEGNNYLMESLVEDPSGVRLCIYRESGYIENDTTIHTIESYYSGKNETKQIDELWHFRQFVHKPDSTNNFIK